MNTQEFNARITKQNMRGIRTGATLQRAMIRLAEMELNPSAFEKAIENATKQIELFVADMESREIKHNTIKMILDNSEQMARKVLQYKMAQYDAKHYAEDHARRMDEISKRMSKIEESVTPSQRGAFNLAVQSSAEITSTSNEIDPNNE